MIQIFLIFVISEVETQLLKHRIMMDSSCTQYIDQKKYRILQNE